MKNLRIPITVLAILALVSGAAQAQSSRWDELANLPFPGAYPTEEAAKQLLDEAMPDFEKVN